MAFKYRVVRRYTSLLMHDPLFKPFTGDNKNAPQMQGGFGFSINQEYRLPLVRMLSLVFCFPVPQA